MRKATIDYKVTENKWSKGGQNNLRYRGNWNGTLTLLVIFQMNDTKCATRLLDPGHGFDKQIHVIMIQCSIARCLRCLGPFQNFIRLSDPVSILSSTVIRWVYSTNYVLITVPVNITL